MNTYKIYFIFVGIVLVMALAVAIGFTLVSDAHKKEIVTLQNEIAKRDVTIETQKGVYSKLASQTEEVMGSLSVSSDENKRLNEELKKANSTALAAQSVAIKWKNAYEASVGGKQTVVAGRKKVEFQKDFGYILAEGWTLTDPPEAFIRVKQGRPLKLSLVMTQGSDKSWKTYATSSEDNIGVDIEVSAVNPYILEAKWYEKIGLHADVGLGSGLLVGVGASYKIGKFTVGPTAWGIINWDLQPRGYFGATLGWNPFQN